MGKWIFEEGDQSKFKIDIEKLKSRIIKQEFDKKEQKVGLNITPKNRRKWLSKWG